MLVGGIPTPLKNMKVSWDYYSQYMKKNTNQVGWFNEISWDLLAFNGTKKPSGVINGWKIPEHMEVYSWEHRQLVSF